jgi:hypothetical protein
VEEFATFIAHKEHNKHCVEPTVALGLDWWHNIRRVYMFICGQIFQEETLGFRRIVIVAIFTINVSGYSNLKRGAQLKCFLYVTIKQWFSRD